MIRLFVCMLIFSAPAQADWEGILSIKMQDQNLTGTIHAKGEKQRVDFTSPLAISTIVDIKAQKALNLIHAQKTYLEMDFAEAAAQFPKCSGSNVDECLKKGGFTKLTTESVNGHRCDVYTAKQKTDDKEMSIKLWRPLDLKEVPAVRSLSENITDGTRAQSDIVNIKMKPQDESLFSAPKDYQSAGNVKDLMDKFKPGSIGTSQ